MYYYPENGSSDYYLNDIRHFLNKNNHNVSVVTPNPVRDLTKESIKTFKNIKFETVEGINIHRLYCGSNNSNSVFNRIKRILVFKRKIKHFLKKNHKNIDAIYIPSNPPIFIPLMVEKMCKKYGILSVYAITDIWPQILGKFSFLNRFAKKAVLKADKVVTLSRDMKQTLFDFAGREDVDVIRIWPDDSVLSNKMPNYDFSFISESKKNIFYIGNIGLFQNLDMFLDVAKQALSNNEYSFYIVGSGRNKQHVIDRINNERIDNVKFISRVNNEVASYFYKKSDLNIISLNKNKIFYACPSKTSTCIFANKPCLLLMDKSLYSDELTQSSDFFLDDSFDAKTIFETIKSLPSNKMHDENMKLLNLYNKENNLKMWLKVFEK